jgi:hypothetical protein
MIFTLVKRLESYSRYGTYSLLYRRRWQIELFFKAIKQNLEIARFYGTSEKVMKTHRISVLHDVPRLLWWFNQMFGALHSEPPVMLFLYGDPMRCFAGFLHLEIKTYSLNRNDSIPQPPESKRDESGSNKTQKSQ